MKKNLHKVAGTLIQKLLNFVKHFELSKVSLYLAEKHRKRPRFSWVMSRPGFVVG
jgi:hypothetical protein